jgi:CysZ protein
LSGGGAPHVELAAAVRSFGLPLAALRLLIRERRLWPLAAVPLLLSVAAVLGALAGIVAFAGEIDAFATGLFPTLRAEVWYAWLWVGPLVALFFVLGKLLFLLAAALAIAAAFVLASLFASPFHDALSRRVEEVVCGSVLEAAEPGLRGALRQGRRALVDELRRLGFFLALALPLAALGLLPGGQLLAAPALAAVSMLFLALDYTGYTLDRRGIRFAEKRRWLRRHLGASLGFGAAALLLCAVPGLNLLALPVLVVAGTLLALRSAPPPRPPVPTPPGVAAGTATSP